MKINSIQTNNRSFKAVLTPVAQAFVAEAFDDVLKNGTKNEIRDAALYYSEIHNKGTASGWKLHVARSASKDGIFCPQSSEESYILKRPNQYDEVIFKTTSKESVSSFDKLRNLALSLTLKAKRKPKMTEKESMEEVEKLSNLFKENGVQGFSL